VRTTIEALAVDPRNDRSHPLENSFAMAARPVNPPARLAAVKPRRGGEHVRRDHLSDLVAGDFLEPAVALPATGVLEGRGGPKSETIKDLGELTLDLRRPHK